MANSTPISNEELDNTTATTVGISPASIVKTETNNTAIVDEEKQSVVKEHVPTPEEVAKKAYYDSQKKLNDAKTKLWETLITIAKVFGVFIGFLLTILTAIWAYNINSIAEPIGGIKENIKNLEKTNDDLSGRINKSDDRLNELMNKLILQNQNSSK